MANFFDKFKVKTAIDSRSKFDLSCDHVSTANFMQFNVAYSKELVPTEKLTVNMETFTRLQPMPVPTFGRAKVNNRAFFVPYRTIFPGWNDFITDSSHTTATGISGRSNFAPSVSHSTLASFFRTGLQTIVTGQFIDLLVQVDNADAIAAGAYDLVETRVNSSGNLVIYWKYTPTGRQIAKLLNSLGYQVSLNTSNAVYSALPILAMAKIYCDWYYPSAYAQTQEVAKVESLFKLDIGGDFSLDSSQLSDIFKLLTSVNYDSDYFVSAWDNPVAPNSDAYSTFDIGSSSYIGQDQVGSGTSVTNDNNEGTPTISARGGQITQFTVDVLKSLTDYMKRHQIVGARALDRYLSRFGIQLSAEKLNRSIYIGSTAEDIQFGDVMSTSNTDTGRVGDYAGKGIGYGTSDFECDTDEYGIFLVISSIIPRTGYYQGVNRNVMHIARTDFWTPEFDNLGTQAISKHELFVPTNTSVEGYTATSYNEIFGFTPRYAEYKVGRDILSGDFRCNSINNGAESWHTMRVLDYTNYEDVVHSRQFMTGEDADQYSRIFYNTDADAADKFNVIYHFNVTSLAPMKPLFDTYEFEDKGKDVIMDVNGVKMN